MWHLSLTFPLNIIGNKIERAECDLDSDSDSDIENCHRTLLGILPFQWNRFLIKIINILSESNVNYVETLF